MLTSSLAVGFRPVPLDSGGPGLPIGGFTSQVLVDVVVAHGAPQISNTRHSSTLEGRETFELPSESWVQAPSIECNADQWKVVKSPSADTEPGEG